MCNHNVCVYVENRNFVDFLTESEIYDIVWNDLYDIYSLYMEKRGKFDFSYRDYIEEYCAKNAETGFEEFDYCPDCGTKLNFEQIKERINNSRKENLLHIMMDIFTWLNLISIIK